MPLVTLATPESTDKSPQKRTSYYYRVDLTTVRAPSAYSRPLKASYFQEAAFQDATIQYPYQVSMIWISAYHKDGSLIIVSIHYDIYLSIMPVILSQNLRIFIHDKLLNTETARPSIYLS